MGTEVMDSNQNIATVDTVTTAWDITRSDGQPTYMGIATPGTGKGEAKWQILKYIYDSNGFITDITWASGTADYKKIWNDRTSYTYS